MKNPSVFLRAGLLLKRGMVYGYSVCITYHVPSRPHLFLGCGWHVPLPPVFALPHFPLVLNFSGA